MARLPFLFLLCVCAVPGRALASPAADAGTPEDTDAQDRDAKLERFKAILARFPKDPDANFNIGILYQLKEEPQRALPHFETALKADKEDWHSLARLVQVNQALGKLKARDRSRARLLALYRAGKVVYPNAQVATVFSRDLFRLGKYWVVALESYEPAAQHGTLYSFEVLSKPEAGQKLRTLTLGSTEPAALPRTDGGTKERLFLLVGHWPDGTQVPYRVFDNEPTYDALRKEVLAILSSELPNGVGPPASN
jgi:tetratricopeptide (TPR) repeat protein